MITINPEIKEILIKNGITPEDGISVLLNIYFKLPLIYFPEVLLQKINTTNLVTKSYKEESVTWLVPLFKEDIQTENQNLEKNKDVWSWVEEDYIKLFSKIGKGSHKRESLTRMKKLFAENPDIRKEDVLGATEAYLINTNSKFARLPHYFIEKGVGSNKTQDILEWIDKYRETIQRLENRDLTRKLT